MKTNSPQGHYVYHILVDNVVKYVGSGKGARYKHGCSGVSSCGELNEIYWKGLGELRVVIVTCGLSKTESIDLERTHIERYGSSLFNKGSPVDKRFLSVLKTNLITSHELSIVIVHWLDNGMSNLKKSLICVYDEDKDKINKEVDWVDYILRSTIFGIELTDSFNKMQDRRDITILKSSPSFDISRFKDKIAMSARIHSIRTEISLMKTIIDLESEVSDLKDKLEGRDKLTTWEEVALSLLSEGKTQKSVAISVGKSINTISRLVKNNKEG